MHFVKSIEINRKFVNQPSFIGELIVVSQVMVAKYDMLGGLDGKNLMTDL